MLTKLGYVVVISAIMLIGFGVYSFFGFGRNSTPIPVDTKFSLPQKPEGTPVITSATIPVPATSGGSAGHSTGGSSGGGANDRVNSECYWAEIPFVEGGEWYRVMFDSALVPTRKEERQAITNTVRLYIPKVFRGISMDRVNVQVWRSNPHEPQMLFEQLCVIQSGVC